MASFTFNSADVQDDGGGDFGPLPAGDYPVVITASEEKATKAGTGHYLAFTLEVIDGEFKGRLLWLNLNHDNPNQQAVDIALRDYKRMHDALGITSSNSTEELHNKPFVVRVGIDKKDNTRNEIKGFKPYGATPTPAPSAPPASAPQSAPAGGKKPWE